MKIYGVAILAGCYLAGQFIGETLGSVLGIGGNVGGVGFAMLFLLIANDWMKKRPSLTGDTNKGILFWSAMYIPVVIAMSATQDIKSALSGGHMAIVAGIAATLACVFLVPVVSKIGKTKSKPHA